MMTTMDEYIKKNALYEKIAQLEELARNRYLDTPSNSPCYSRYMAQLNERTAFKHIIADFPSADVKPIVQCRDCIVPHNKYTGCPELNGLVTPPDFYCPFGKRKDGDK